MRTRARWVMTIGMSSLMLSPGQPVAAQDQRTAILNAERTSAGLSRDSGFEDAILASIHQDGILLWPGAPVVAGTSELKRFLPALQTDSLQLTWQPLGVELARDSSLGITWGVAVASARRNPPSPEIGSYIAAWRRDGARWTIAGLLTRGPKAIGRAVDFPAVWRWHPVAAGAAGTGDLGWTVGEANIASKDAALTHSKYLTIWLRGSDGAVGFLTDGGNSRPAATD